MEVEFTFLCNLNTAVTHFFPPNSQGTLFPFYQYHIETTKKYPSGRQKYFSKSERARK